MPKLGREFKGENVMFLIMGFLHLVASLVLAIDGSDTSIVYSQFIGGIVELVIGFYFYIKYEEII